MRPRYPIRRQRRPDPMIGIWVVMVLPIFGFFGALFLLWAIAAAHGRDNGQYAQTDPAIKRWHVDTGGKINIRCFLPGTGA
jgi:hypothetical protein